MKISTNYDEPGNENTSSSPAVDTLIPDPLKDESVADIFSLKSPDPRDNTQKIVKSGTKAWGHVNKRKR